MAKSDYANPNDVGFGTQLQTFKTNVRSYAVVLGLTLPAQAAEQAADADRALFRIVRQLAQA